MENKNIRQKEKYVTLRTLFNNTMRLFQNVYDKNSYDKLLSSSAFYTDALEFYKHNPDASLLIFALPGLIMRNQVEQVIHVYQTIVDVVCGHWDSYSPNYSDSDDYLYLRLQDILTLDKMYYLIAEFTYISKDYELNIKRLIQGIEEDDLLLILGKHEDRLAALDKFLVQIRMCVNKIYTFVKRIIDSVDNEEVSSVFVADSVTFNSLSIIISNLDAYKQKLAESVVEPTAEAQETNVGQAEGMKTNADVLSIINNIKAIDSKQNNHILVLALKYVVKNFHISNKLMMEKMLSDDNYSKVVSIILDEFSNK